MRYDSTAKGYNPCFKEGYAALAALCDKYAGELDFVTLDARELVDEYSGEVYQVVPVLRVSFK
jgi:hypothetical protein